MKKEKALLVSAIAAVILAAAAFITKSISNKSDSIGIIGGADGPTSIFISGSPSVFTVISTVFGFLAAVAAIVALVIMFKKNKK